MFSSAQFPQQTTQLSLTIVFLNALMKFNS